MNIAFFGTSNRSIPILEQLKKDFNLVLCVTKNDVIVGRKQERKSTEVKIWAKENNINYVTISSLKGHDLELVSEQIKNSNIDYVLVVDFSFIIPNELLELLPDRFINIHFSLLPKYRGSSPVQQAIINGDEMSGISYLLVARKLDSGSIIKQIGYKLSYNETSGALYEILFELAAENVSKVINDFSQGVLKPLQQDEEKATYTYSRTKPQSTHIFKEDAFINWKEDTKVIERKIRAYNPWPIAWTYLVDIEKNLLLPNDYKLKTSVNKELQIKVFTAKLDENNKLIIETLQLEGKNRMNWKDFENGYLEKIEKKKRKLFSSTRN